MCGKDSRYVKAKLGKRKPPRGKGWEPNANMTSIVAGEQSGQQPADIDHVFLMCHRQVPVGGRDDGILGADSLGSPVGALEPEPLADALENAGYQVTWSQNPLDSKRLLERVRPSIVILDPLVCSADGVEFELAARLRVNLPKRKA